MPENSRKKMKVYDKFLYVNGYILKIFKFWWQLPTVILMFYIFKEYFVAFKMDFCLFIWNVYFRDRGKNGEKDLLSFALLPK